MVDFPEPEGPTMAVVNPAVISKEAFINTGWCSARAVGYLKVTFSKLILLSRVIGYPNIHLSELRTSGFLSITSNMSFPTVIRLVIA
jgi:hypothetical protein